MIFTTIPISAIASWKVNQMNRCTSSPQFYVSVEGWRFDPNINTALYHIEIGLKVDDGVIIIALERRYSELYQVYKALEKRKTVMPEFPPKKVFGNQEIEFIRDRRMKLHKYFEKISSIPAIGQIEEFSKCFSYVSLKNLWGSELNRELFSN